MPEESMQVPNRKYELEKLEFEKALELRNFEITNFWTRAWFFGALLVAIATAYIEVGKEENRGLNHYGVYIAFMGLLVSFFQCLMNRGSKYWQERWENKTKNRESQLGIDLTKTKNSDERWLLDAATLAKNENFFTLPRRFSVTKLTILVWDIITITWGILWFSNLNLHVQNPKYWDWPVIVIHAFIIGYIFIFFFGKRQNTQLEDGKKDKSYLIHWLRWENGGGGKVYEQFVRKYDHSTHTENVDHRYFNDSEAYVKNDKEKLKQIHKERTEQLFKKYMEELDPSAKVEFGKNDEMPQVICAATEEQKKKMVEYWASLNNASKPFS